MCACKRKRNSLDTAGLRRRQTSRPRLLLSCFLSFCLCLLVLPFLQTAVPAASIRGDLEHSDTKTLKSPGATQHLCSQSCVRLSYQTPDRTQLKGDLEQPRWPLSDLIKHATGLLRIIVHAATARLCVVHVQDTLNTGLGMLPRNLSRRKPTRSAAGIDEIEHLCSQSSPVMLHQPKVWSFPVQSTAMW